MASPKYFRNTAMIHGIEAGALWRQEKDKLILVDDDQHVTSELTTEFQEVEEE